MSREGVRMKHKTPSIGEASWWEVRPGGMLVQRRSSDAKQGSTPVPMIKVKVKYGSIYHEISISSQASFGELKKMLAGPTGLHPDDQKLLFKDKERDSKWFLDVSGVKNGSKLVLVEDELARERRILESRKTATMEAASKEIASIRCEVDKLAKQVANIELDIYGGKKVGEAVLLSLIESLMMQLIKLDGISADGDVKLQRRMQVTRVQKYIENLDKLKIRNSTLGSNGRSVPLQQQQRIFTGQMPTTIQKQSKQGNYTERNTGPVITTKWETF